RPQDSTIVLHGRKLFVPYALGADHLLVLGRTGSAPDALTFFLVSGGLDVVPMAGMSNDKLFEVNFENLRLPSAAQLGPLNSGWTAFQSALPRAAVIQSAELVGLADHAFELAVEYAKQRVA